MKIIDDPVRKQFYMQQVPLLEKYKSRSDDIFLFFYEKGEIITSPLIPQKHIMFVIEGSFQLYDISSEGIKAPMGFSGDAALIGDIEFCWERSESYEPFYVEAVTDLYSVSLPIKVWKETLVQDLQFLQILNHALAMKVNTMSNSYGRTKTVEERLMIYLKHRAPDHTLTNVEQAAALLRCSRRQLQRVLHDQCEAGAIEKAGKGKYRLVEEKYQSVMDDRHSV